MQYLHIIGQIKEKDEIDIIGTRNALEKLKKAIDRALQNEDHAAGDTFNCTDEQTYTINISLLEEKYIKLMKPPYSDIFGIFKDE